MKLITGNYIIYQDKDKVYHYRTVWGSGDINKLGAILYDSFKKEDLIISLFDFNHNFRTVDHALSKYLKKHKEKNKAEIIKEKYFLEINSSSGKVSNQNTNNLDELLAKIGRAGARRFVYVFMNNEWFMNLSNYPGVLPLDKVIKIDRLEEIVFETTGADVKKEIMVKYLVKNKLANIDQNIIKFSGFYHGTDFKKLLEEALILAEVILDKKDINKTLKNKQGKIVYNKL